MALSEMLLTMTPFTTDWEEDVDPAEARALQPIMIERSPAHTDAENNLLFIICIYPFLLFPVCFLNLLYYYCYNYCS